MIITGRAGLAFGLKQIYTNDASLIGPNVYIRYQRTPTCNTKGNETFTHLATKSNYNLLSNLCTLALSSKSNKLHKKTVPLNFL